MKMKNEEREFLLLGGSFLLAPFLAVAIALPLYFWTKEPGLPIVMGTVGGMALYIGACFLNGKLKSASDDET